MLAGFSGHLVSEQFLEQCLAEGDGHIDPGACAQTLRQWRATQHSLGPASSLRAMLEAGAAPLACALGFGAADDVQPSDTTIAATLRGTPTPITLIVVRWGEPLDPLWRSGVLQAIRREAQWCLLFNGTHVRLLHADRVLSRRFVEFDLDSAVDDERTAAAMWTLLGADGFSGAQRGETTRVERVVEGSDRHASSVCRSLRDGVLEASEQVLGALLDRPGRKPVDDAFA